jgi:hypothetical protein
VMGWITTAIGLLAVVAFAVYIWISATVGSDSDYEPTPTISVPQ